MLGLPGDFTPPSRFVRAVAFSQSVLPSKTGDDAVLEAFHILNQFDIPKGSARDTRRTRTATSWPTTRSGPRRAISRRSSYYFRTYDNSQIRMLDLMKMDLDGRTS